MPIKNEKEWYSSYYSTLGKYRRLKNYWNLIHLRKMKFFGEVPVDSIIVDIGCGNGNMLVTLKSKGYSNLYGFDIRIPEVYDKDFSITKGSMLDMPYDDDFADTLICFNVMHHLFSYEQYIEFLGNCRRVLKKGGKFFLVEPHDNPWRKLQDILVKISLVSSFGPIRWQKKAVLEEKNEIDRFLRINLRDLFGKQGFDIIRYGPYFKSQYLYCRNITKGGLSR